MRQPLGAYLWERIEWSTRDACWPWLLKPGSHGYGQTATGVCAHRLLWTYLFGDPGEMTVDHACHNRMCCNPFHFRLKTNVDNARDNGMATRTHCPRLHEYDEENTYVGPTGGRRCRQCARDRVRGDTNAARARRRAGVR